MGWCVQIKDAERKSATLIHEHIWMRESKKPESTIVRNVNKRSNDAAAAKFKLQEETFAKEFINWMFMASHSQWLFYKAKRAIRLDRNHISPPPPRCTQPNGKKSFLKDSAYERARYDTYPDAQALSSYST